MAHQTFKSFPIRPGFAYEFTVSPQKIDPDVAAFPENAAYRSRITSDMGNAANGGTIETGDGITRIDDNTLTLIFPASVTQALVTKGAANLAKFDIIRTDPAGAGHLNIEVEIPIVRSITPNG